MRIKKSLAVEQVFIIGLFLILFVVLVWITFYTAKKAKVIDEEDIRDKIGEEKIPLIFDVCEELLDREMDVGEFYELFSYISGGGCIRGADQPYKYTTAFLLNRQILEEAAVSGGFIDSRNNPEIIYQKECNPLKNSRIFSVQESVVGAFGFLLYTNSMGGASICDSNSLEGG